MSDSDEDLDPMLHAERPQPRLFSRRTQRNVPHEEDQLFSRKLHQPQAAPALQCSTVEARNQNRVAEETAQQQQRRHQEDTQPKRRATEERVVGKLDEVGGKESYSLPNSDTASQACKRRKIKHAISRKEPAAGTGTRTSQANATERHGHISLTQSPAAHIAQSASAQALGRSTTILSQRVQRTLREGTFAQSSQMPEHKHFHYPGKDWRDKSQPPPEADEGQCGSPGAWICQRLHAWGQYIMSSNKTSCAGCGDTRGRPRADRMPWDLKREFDYVINNEEKNSAFIPKADLQAEIKPSSKLEGLHVNGRAARMRIFLERMFPTATVGELQQYWSRPFEWTDKGRRQARELMREIMEEAQADGLNDDLSGTKILRNSQASKAAKLPARRSAASQAQEETLEKTGEAPDIHDAGPSPEARVPGQDISAQSGQEPLPELTEHELPSIAHIGGDEIENNHRNAPRTGQEEDLYSSVHREPARRSREDLNSLDLARNDPQFYRLLFNAVKDLSDADQADLKQHISKVCALTAWNTMERVPDDRLFRRLVGFFSWRAHVDDDARFTMPFSQRMVDEVRGLYEQIWPDYSGLLLVLHYTGAAQKVKYEVIPNAEV